MISFSHSRETIRIFLLLFSTAPRLYPKDFRNGWSQPAHFLFSHKSHASKTGFSSLNDGPSLDGGKREKPSSTSGALVAFLGTSFREQYVLLGIALMMKFCTMRKGEGEQSRL